MKCSGGSSDGPSQELHQLPLLPFSFGLRVLLRLFLLFTFTSVLLSPVLHGLLIGDGRPPVLFHVPLVVSLKQGEALQLVEGQVVAGDKVEAPGAELVGIVQLRRQQKT